MEFTCEGTAKFKSEAPFLQKVDIYSVPELDPRKEEEREEAARRLREIGSSAQDECDALTTLAASILSVPVCFITLIDSGHMFFKSVCGIWTHSEIPLPPSEEERHTFFCYKCMRNANELLVVNDAMQDPHWRKNPYVKAEGGLRFFAGIPLETPSGHRFGSLSALDDKPRELTESQMKGFIAIGKQIMNAMMLRVQNYELTQAHEVLEAKNKELELLTKEKLHILSMVSHDMRQPLCSIQVCAELLSQEPLPDSAVELVDTILTSAQLANSLINDSLKISPSRSSSPNVKKKCDILSLIRKSILTNDLIARYKPVSLHLQMDCKEKSLEVMTDPSIFERMLNNLLSNAIKFSHPNSQVIVKVSLDSDKMNINISVQDFGVGIPPNELKLLFHDTLKPTVQATKGEKSYGLGLLFVQKVVTDWGGNIDVSSEVGKGTTFTISLPLVYADAPSPERPQVNNKRKAPERTLNILVVEDNLINQHMLKRLLSKLGHNVICASDGVEGLDMLSSHEIDLMFTDAHMPHMDGFEMVKRLKLSHEGADGCEYSNVGKNTTKMPKIISISGDTTDSVETRWKECGVFHQLSKPFTIDQLVNEIHAVMDL